MILYIKYGEDRFTPAKRVRNGGLAAGQAFDIRHANIRVISLNLGFFISQTIGAEEVPLGQNWRACKVGPHLRTEYNGRGLRLCAGEFLSAAPEKKI